MTDRPEMPKFPIKVFFDGSCSVCAAEIESYLRQERSGKLLAVDISAPDFNPEPYHIPLDVFMHELHVIDADKNVYRGIEAFVAIWQAFPSLSRYRFMAALIGLPIVNPVAQLIYKGFAAIRPYLPKRKGSCSNGICRLNR